MSEHESFVKSLEEVIGAAMDPGVAFANPSLQDIQRTVKAAIHGYIAMHVPSKMSLAKIDSIVNSLIPSNAASKDFNSELFVTTITEFIHSTIEPDSLTGIDFDNSESSKWNLFCWGSKDLDQELIDNILKNAKPSNNKIWYVPQTYRHHASLLGLHFHYIEVNYQELTNDDLDAIIVLGHLEGKFMGHHIGSLLNPPAVTKYSEGRLANDNLHS